MDLTLAKVPSFPPFDPIAFGTPLLFRPKTEIQRRNYEDPIQHNLVVWVRCFVGFRRAYVKRMSTPRPRRVGLGEEFPSYLVFNGG